MDNSRTLTAQSVHSSIRSMSKAIDSGSAASTLISYSGLSRVKRAPEKGQINAFDEILSHYLALCDAIRVYSRQKI